MTEMMLADITTKNPAKLKEWLDDLPAAEKGRAFEQVLAELYRGNGWLVSIQGQRGDEGADILLYHPKTPQAVSLIIQAKNHAKPLTLDQTRIELIKFEQQAAPRHKCQQFRLVAVNGFVEDAAKLGQFNLLLNQWDHVAGLLKNYDPERNAEPDIELFAHNRTAYRRVKELWQENNQVAVVQATGTGKSFVIAKVLADFHAKQKIVLAPSHYILDQQKSKVPWLNDRTTYWTYAGLMRKSVEKIKALKCSLIVLDEYHRCGADEWGKGVQRLLDSHPKAKILGTSATPIRYLDESRDMSEELFDGVVAVDLSLAEAIVKRILPAPTYISALYTLDEEIKAVQVEIDGSKRSVDEKAKYRQETEELKVNWEKTLGVPEILKKYLPADINKLIVFCKDQEHLDQMESEVDKWFQKAGTHRWREKYRVLSAYPDSNKNLERFRAADSKDTVHILFAIDMLNEGLHIPEVGAVILLRPTESPNIFYQQIGRCIEVGANHTPIIFDLVNNLQSIRVSDYLQDLKDAEVEENRKRNELGLDTYAPSVSIEDLSRDIEEVIEGIRERLAPWEIMFECLVAFKKKLGHCNVPATYPENPSLGAWVSKQRAAWKKLTDKSNLPDRFRRLEEIGFSFTPFAEAWEQMFKDLQAFRALEGHCNVPRLYPPNPALGFWVSRQRRVWTRVQDKDNLPERMRRLEALGFIWDLLDAKWEKMFDELQAFKEKEGHCNVPRDYTQNPDLAQWVGIQRYTWKMLKDKVNLPGRLRRLDEIGFVWSVFDMVWEKMFEELREFKAREGHCNVPNRYQANPALAEWVSTQRKAWKELNDRRNLPERFRRLESVGFVWDLIGGIWEKRFEELRAFKEKEGHCNVPQKYPLNTALARWVVSQRGEWKKLKDKINLPERFRRLEELGFVWDVYAAPWEAMFKCLVAFEEKHGHCNVPATYPENPSLGRWVSGQRAVWKNLTDKSNLPERFRRLEALGFMWILKGKDT